MWLNLNGAVERRMEGSGGWQRGNVEGGTALCPLISGARVCGGEKLTPPSNN